MYSIPERNSISEIIPSAHQDAFIFIQDGTDDCSKITKSTGADQIPAVRESIGRMAAQEAAISAMIHGQIEAAEDWPEDYMTFNRRMMYATLDWCTDNHSALIDELRTFCGGGVFQMPGNVHVMHDEKLRSVFEKYFQILC